MNIMQNALLKLFLGMLNKEIIGRHTPILNKCMDISQQAGSKRKFVSEFKNIYCAILHSFQ